MFQTNELSASNASEGRNSCSQHWLFQSSSVKSMYVAISMLLWKIGQKVIHRLDLIKVMISHNIFIIKLESVAYCTIAYNYPFNAVR